MVGRQLRRWLQRRPSRSSVGMSLSNLAVLVPCATEAGLVDEIYALSNPVAVGSRSGRRVMSLAPCV